MDAALYNLLAYGVQYEQSQPVVLDALFATKDQCLFSSVVSELPRELINNLPKHFINSEILDEANIREEGRSDAGCSIDVFANLERFKARKLSLNQVIT